MALVGQRAVGVVLHAGLLKNGSSRTRWSVRYIKALE